MLLGVLGVALVGADCFSRIALPLFVVKFVAIFVAVGGVLFQSSTLPPPTNATAAGCPRGGWSLGSNAFVAFTGAGCYFGPRARLLRENAFPDWTSTATGLPRDAVIKQGTTLNAFGSHGLFVFALLFPGVTGIITGTNLSANLSSGLADPHRAIPRGTLWAVFTSVVVHVVIVLAFAASFSRATLHTDTNLFVLLAPGTGAHAFGPNLVLSGKLICSSMLLHRNLCLLVRSLTCGVPS